MSFKNLAGFRAGDFCKINLLHYLLEPAFTRKPDPESSYIFPFMNSLFLKFD